MEKVYLEPSEIWNQEIRYIIDVLFNNKDVAYQFVSDKALASVTFGTSSDYDLQFNPNYFKVISQRRVIDGSSYNRSGFLTLENSEVDYLSTAFYLISCYQELEIKERDEFGRFRYTDSYQLKYNCVEENRVQICFDSIFSKLKILQPNFEKKKSKIVLTHDIDSVYGSKLQDTYYLVKKGKLLQAASVLFKNLFVEPSWLNAKLILQIEGKFSFKSIFFFLPLKGMSKYSVMNSDYNIKSDAIKQEMQLVENAGSIVGIHKAISDLSYETELALFDKNLNVNRNHYLAFDPHLDFLKLESASIDFDFSLGFAETMGFRNSYGKEYKPYIFSERRSSTVVEYPLNIMDTTFSFYERIDGNSALLKIKKFIEANKYDSTIVVLFHNNYFSNYKYKTYYKAYLELLEFIHEKQFEVISKLDISAN